MWRVRNREEVHCQLGSYLLICGGRIIVPTFSNQVITSDWDSLRREKCMGPHKHHHEKREVYFCLLGLFFWSPYSQTKSKQIIQGISQKKKDEGRKYSSALEGVVCCTYVYVYACICTYTWTAVQNFKASLALVFLVFFFSLPYLLFYCLPFFSFLKSISFWGIFWKILGEGSIFPYTSPSVKGQTPQTPHKDGSSTVIA